MALNWQELLESADQLGIKLEVVEGLPTWEAWPATRHQLIVQTIQSTIRAASEGASCGCHQLADIYIRFPDGSLKRPDIAIFCNPPPIQDETLELVPEAVVEVVSKGYEKKDLVIAPPFYLSQGVRDVVVVDPYSKSVHHHTAGGTKTQRIPATLVLDCGCLVDV